MAKHKKHRTSTHSKATRPTPADDAHTYGMEVARNLIAVLVAAPAVIAISPDGWLATGYALAVLTATLVYALAGWREYHHRLRLR